jgi:hypothetical protein
MLCPEIVVAEPRGREFCRRRAAEEVLDQTAIRRGYLLQDLPAVSFGVLSPFPQRVVSLFTLNQRRRCMR